MSTHSSPDLWCPVTRSHGLAGRVVWATDMHAVASASDDRSVMLWPLPDLAEGPQQRGPVTVSASRVLTGHQARLWDAKFCGEVIITASEDCTCRLGVQIAQECDAHICHHSRRPILHQAKFAPRAAEGQYCGFAYVNAGFKAVTYGDTDDQLGLLQ